MTDLFHIRTIEVAAHSPFKRYKRKTPPTKIIIHHSWTYTVAACVDALCKKGCGTNYTIDRDGSICCLQEESNYYVCHCKGNNPDSIGIDLIRGNGQAILPCQYESLNDLLVILCDKWGFKCPVLHENIIFYHRDLRPTACPGEIDDDQIIY